MLTQLGKEEELLFVGMSVLTKIMRKRRNMTDTTLMEVGNGKKYRLT